MRKVYGVLLVVGALVIMASSGGRNDVRTQAPGDNQTCQNCHGSATGNGSVTLNGISDPIIAGQTYSLTLTLVDPGQVQGGFQIAATNSIDNSSVGTFSTPAGSGARVVTSSSGVGRVTHSTPKSFGGTSSTDWTFDWTAPSGSPDNIQFYYVGNATNGAGTGGDFVYFGNTAAIALPVEWAYTKASKVKTGVLVEWATHQESNNDYFEIQKSYNGRDFYALDKVEGRGYHHELSDYSYIDESKNNSEVLYYRIKQVDLDGVFAFSDITKIEVKSATRYQVYPNPVIDYMTIESEHPSKYTLFNMNGMALRSVTVEGTLSVDLSNLTSGNYYLMSETGDFEKIVKQ